MSEPMPNRPSVAAEGAKPFTARDPDLAAVRAAQRDPAEFAALYHRYLDPVYSYALYQRGDHHDAEDATALANAHRTRARRRTEPIDAIPLEPSAPDADPAGLALRAEDARRIRAAVAALPEDRRQVVLLRFADGLTAREIGEVLDRSEGAVRVLLHRALKDLAGQLRA
ncbi:MAG: RNA polymerase sigma factor [Chloroflexi bacterium]|nr:MAG: RNA polymerase sigma factor [Chloroflexota bacterium]